MMAKPHGWSGAMHEWGTRMLLKHYVNQRLTKTELSTRFGVSRVGTLDGFSYPERLSPS